MDSSPITIEKIVHGGFGLGHDANGLVHLISGVIPGEIVKVRLTDKEKSLARGAAQEILQNSVQRVVPPCPYYGLCGGCNFQHMNYPCQLQMKEEILRDLLQRTGHPELIQAAEQLLQPPLPSPQQFHYRQRIRLQVDHQLQVGFHGARSHQCVPIEECLLARPEINSCLQKLHVHTAFRNLLPHSHSMELLLDPNSGGVVFLIHMRRKPRPKDETHGRRLLEEIEEIQSLFFNGEDFAMKAICRPPEERGTNTLSFTLPHLPPHTHRPLTLSWEPGGFCQVNLEQNPTLIATVLDSCGDLSETDVLDLFCGMGNFSIPLAEKAQSVMGIEGQGAAIRSARKNSARAGQDNTVFSKQAIHRACAELVGKGRRFDCLVVDPPRQGIPGLAQALGGLCKKRLVYVSCDPATLCRDLTSLLDQGFTLLQLQPVDMFPQTHHIETVLTLERH